MSIVSGSGSGVFRFSRGFLSVLLLVLLLVLAIVLPRILLFNPRSINYGFLGSLDIEYVWLDNSTLLFNISNNYSETACISKIVIGGRIYNYSDLCIPPNTTYKITINNLDLGRDVVYGRIYYVVGDRRTYRLFILNRTR